MDADTTLRCLGYALDFFQIVTLPLILAAITWRLAK